MWSKINGTKNITWPDFGVSGFCANFPLTSEITGLIGWDCSSSDCDLRQWSMPSCGSLTEQILGEHVPMPVGLQGWSFFYPLDVLAIEPEAIWANRSDRAGWFSTGKVVTKFRVEIDGLCIALLVWLSRSGTRMSDIKQLTNLFELLRWKCFRGLCALPSGKPVVECKGRFTTVVSWKEFVQYNPYPNPSIFFHLFPYSLDGEYAGMP